VQTNALSSYSVMGGSAISAQTDFTSTSVQVHPPLLPGVNEVVTVAACANEVTFTSANTDVSGGNAVVFDDVQFADPSIQVVAKPPLPPGSPPPPSPPPHPSDYACNDNCPYLSDGDCDDGGQGASYALCSYGTDCTDCHARPPNTLADSHYVLCGRSNFERCVEAERLAPNDELHEVRCCSDTVLEGWVKNNGCNVWATSVINGQCHHLKTYIEATVICQTGLGRLCSKQEIANDCTIRTGCAHDRDVIWSNSTS